MDRDELLRVLRAFQEKDLEYVLIGATAMGFHGLIRATEDVDLLIRPTPENVERLRKALQDTYSDDPSIQDIRTEDLLGDYPAVRYYPVNGDLFFDILTRLGDAASYETVESQKFEVEGVRVQVATPQALYKLKKDTVRPIDTGRTQPLSESGLNWETDNMSVERFRSIEEMNSARNHRDTRDAFERFVRHCARYRLISRRSNPHGVFKFHSIEEAQAARQISG
ncbi:MAG TPA: nucleotidyl transferase AbiEii/AbiGii toxin family protein [Acidobacteriota bacterium]|nr:nucleotidyl transferase AbiEii/AbiGii toxin family protein [Acidobacteriota bacterium]